MREEDLDIYIENLESEIRRLREALSLLTEALDYFRTIHIGTKDWSDTDEKTFKYCTSMSEEPKEETGIHPMADLLSRIKDPPDNLVAEFKEETGGDLDCGGCGQFECLACRGTGVGKSVIQRMGALEKDCKSCDGTGRQREETGGECPRCADTGTIHILSVAGKETVVSKDEWLKAERTAGFAPKPGLGPYATAGFSTGALSGRLRKCDHGTGRQRGDDEAATINVVFDGPPDNPAPRFVEVEDQNGKSFKAGEWVERPDGLWELQIPARLISNSEDENV